MIRMFALALATVAVAFAAEPPAQLNIVKPKVEADQVTAPVVLNGDVGKGVSVITFKLNYDTAIFKPLSIKAGKAATDAGKSAQGNASAKGGIYSVIIAGLNNNTMTAGEIANITLQRIGKPEKGPAKLTIASTSMASPAGVAVPSQGSQCEVDLSAGAAPNATPKANEAAAPAKPAPSKPAAPAKSATPEAPKGK